MNRDDYPDDTVNRASVRAQILAVAKQLLTGQLDVITAARRLSALHDDAEPEIREALVGFVAIDSETDTLPIGEVRQYWRLDALERKDREIAQAEQCYRDTAVKDAAELIRLLEIPS
jgi:hypothetical protein